MFEKFKRFIGTHDLPNDFYPVPPLEIEAAELRMGYPFPNELRSFFLEIGSGFYRQGAKDADVDRFLINRIIPPNEVADLVCEVENSRRPMGGLLDDEMPFMDIGDRDYLILWPKSDCPNRVYGMRGELIANSLVEFFDKLHDSAGFFVELERPGTDRSVE
jgi:hypothetical protein